MQEAKFRIEELLGIGFAMIVLVIGIAYGLDITGDVKDDMGTDSCAARGDGMTSYNVSSDQCYDPTAFNESAVTSAEFNASVDGITAVSKIPAKLPTVATIVMAAVVIGILLTYLYARFAR